MTEESLFELLSLECRVVSNGILRYYNTAGQLHRVHGPAVVCTNGSKFWYQNGRRHRVDGPAIEYSDGSKFWFIDGIMLTEAECLQQVASMENV